MFENSVVVLYVLSDGAISSVCHMFPGPQTTTGWYQHPYYHPAPSLPPVLPVPAPPASTCY